MSEKNQIGIGKAIILMIVSALIGGGVAAGIFFAAGLDNGSNVGSESGSSQILDVDISSLPQESAVAVSVAAKVSPSVVSITSKGFYTNPFFGQSEKEVDLGSGSGVIYTEDGYIITNNHVVEGASKLTVATAGGDLYTAEVIGTDPRTDLAVIKIDAKNLPKADFGNSEELQVGEFAMAIGNPGGDDYARSATRGQISGLNRMLTTSDGYQFDLIQTDAAINPGNSGGPLVNAKGEVVGINTVKIVESGFEGMGFAIPSKTVVNICDQLMKDGKVVRPALGVGMIMEITPENAKFNGLKVDKGVMIVPIEGGSAIKAGMEAYDIITKIDDQEINEAADLQQYILNKKVGDKVKVYFVRGDEEKNVEITLTQMSEK